TERLQGESRMNPTRRRESVCRNLFGPVDHEQLRRDLKLKLREITERDSRRWNFNFESGTPLPGSFQWEETPADCAAHFYQEAAERKPAESAFYALSGSAFYALGESAQSAGSDQENKSIVSNKHPAEVTPARRKRALCKLATKPRNNAKITGKHPLFPE
uniref:Cyclin-dependent kinase inhibitor domain-containing protein n=1 Tax=Salarias fasciatus TaxID=181472 RepID=A0A672GRC2_SALFA